MSISGVRLARYSDERALTPPLPTPIVPDNGPEALGEVFTGWATKAAGIAIQYIQPSKPNQNAYIERFNRTYRNEHLDPYLFTSLDDVREAIYRWMLEYNEERPHDPLGDRTPSQARQQAAGKLYF